MAYKKLSDFILEDINIINFLDGDSPLENIFDLYPNISKDRLDVFKKLYSSIGKTPVYSIQLENNVFVDIKLEYYNNNGENHYSRYWIIYLFLCEVYGVITPRQTKIIEVTSGSSGISASFACKHLGYNLTMIVPDILPNSRVQPMIDNGVKIIRSKNYIKGCIRELKKQLILDRGLFAANHSEEESDIITKVFSRISKEYILAGYKPDISILGLGNGSSLEAIGNELKNVFPNIKIYSIRPDFRTKSKVLGLLAPDLNFRHLNNAISLTDKIEYTNNICIDKIRSNFKNDCVISQLGHSSLYSFGVALNLSKKLVNKRIFLIGYDKINRYYD